jgi:hypothetical protein
MKDESKEVINSQSAWIGSMTQRDEEIAAREEDGHNGIECGSQVI